MKIHLVKLLRSAFPLVVLCLAACGGGTETYSVSGTLTGLAAGNSITLTNNGTDILTLTANGAFTFPAKLANAAPYKLTLSATTPTVQPCASTDGAGTINASNVSALKVACDEVAGLVQFVNGEVQQTTPAGQTHVIQKGDAVNEGDTLSSSPKATAKIRMSDGGLITMRSDTQFKIDNYKFNGKQDGSEQSFFSLIKGGFRSVTGLIGKLHKKSYRIVTPSAALGIRGTDHEILYVAPGSDLAKLSPVGTYDKVNSGATTLTNDKGTIAILPKQMGYVAAPDQKPVLQPVNTRLFTAEEPLYPFDGRWATKLVCDDTRDKKGLVKGYTWAFDVTIEHGKLKGQYGQPGKPGSGTYIGQVQSDGTVAIDAHGNTGKTEYTVGKVTRGTPFSYPMKGKFSGSTGHATRTKLRPCEATFTKRQEMAE
jgi:hypothetical protein